MKKHLMVLDIDDTLTQSEDQHQQAYVDSMRHFGIKDINQNWSGYDHMTDSFILKENYELNLKRNFDFSFVTDFEDYMTNRMLELKSVSEIIGASNAVRHIIDETEFAVCFATGSFLKPAIQKLQQAGIPANPELVVGSNAHFTREEIVQASIHSAMDYYDVPKFNQIISVGDGLWDWKTAKNLGIHFIGIGPKNKSGFKSKKIPLHIQDWTGFDVNMSLAKLTVL